MTTTKISINPQLSSTLCSQCSSMAHFKCIDHCNDVFCGKCSVKHRTAVTNQMNDLAGQLKLCKIDPVTTHDEIDNNFIRASNQTIRRTRDTVNNLITEIQQREKTIITEIECILEARQEEKKKRTDSALLTSEEAVDYTRLLMNCLKQDQLIDVDTLAAIQRRLEARSALGVEMSVRLSKILGTEKDKILAGAWCEYSQRLILVGNHRMYFYDLQGQEHAKKFRCEPKHGDPGNTPRFLNCTHDGSIFYAYKSVSNSYIIEKHAYPSFLSKKNDDNDQEDTTHFFQTKQGIKTNDHLAAMCVTHNRIALVYRSFPPDKLLEHFICLLDHDFKNLKYERASLPSDIKWITAIASFGNDDQYLLCDPRGQQLLLYRSTDGILTRRFRIGALNACCLTDGKLVLWLQKQYASSPTGKLHFITAPHLEERTNVSKSLPLLTQK
ncbi:unnamed protein product [Rotaria magnacalcarata]|uniref:Uncharacterized protein n=1 Tax=Rotaria magnacalcarata TaxID=392030 RepID=A0A8S2NWA4_9BILA|nr:unnamed protein product [Rotaria magnacalcarata]